MPQRETAADMVLPRRPGQPIPATFKGCRIDRPSSLGGQLHSPTTGRPEDEGPIIGPLQFKKAAQRPWRRANRKCIGKLMDPRIGSSSEIKTTSQE